MIIVLFGKPGAGKGTQAPLLANGARRPDAGDGRRAARRDARRHAARARGKGLHGPRRPRAGFRHSRHRRRGAGEARVRQRRRSSTAPCAPFRRPRDWRRCSRSLGRKVDAVLAFDIDNDEIVRRLSGRTVCEKCQTPYTGREPASVCDKCGGTLVRRKDDDPDAVRTRLRVYDEQTAPVLDWYKQGGQQRRRRRTRSARVERRARRARSRHSASDPAQVGARDRADGAGRKDPRRHARDPARRGQARHLDRRARPDRRGFHSQPRGRGAGVQRVCTDFRAASARRSIRRSCTAFRRRSAC